MLDFFINHIDDVLTVVGAASTIATITPTKADDTVIGFIQKLIHMLALNIGKATAK